MLNIYTNSNMKNSIGASAMGLSASVHEGSRPHGKHQLINTNFLFVWCFVIIFRKGRLADDDYDDDDYDAFDEVDINNDNNNNNSNSNNVQSSSTSTTTSSSSSTSSNQR